VSLLNRAAEKILGVRAAEVIGARHLAELMLEPHTRRPEKGEQDTLQPFLQRADGEQSVIDNRGHEHVIQLSTSPIRDHDGALAGTLLIFTDITQQRRTEAELRSKQMQLIQSSRMATLGEMAAGVAHELNQPLNNIGLLSARVSRRLARRQSLDAEDAVFLKDKLTTMQEQVARAAKIIDHLRVFGRAEPAPLTAVDVDGAVKGALTLLGEQLHLHDIYLDVDIPSDLPRVRGDPSRLEQVLINLIVNARFALDSHGDHLKASGETKRLSIRAESGEIHGGDAAVLIHVEDNGPGMTDDVAARVFEPFFTTKEVGTGTGLGLSISYGIVREFGGILSVHTAPGEGARFTIALHRDTTETQA
jgi:histidine kinase